LRRNPTAPFSSAVCTLFPLCLAATLGVAALVCSRRDATSS
jgi:hypothetical protein